MVLSYGPIHTYFTTWLIRMNSYNFTRTNYTIFAKSYIFYKLHNSYEFIWITFYFSNIKLSARTVKQTYFVHIQYN